MKNNFLTAIILISAVVVLTLGVGYANVSFAQTTPNLVCCFGEEKKLCKLVPSGYCIDTLDGNVFKLDSCDPNPCSSTYPPSLSDDTQNISNSGSLQVVVIQTTQLSASSPTSSFAPDQTGACCLIDIERGLVCEQTISTNCPGNFKGVGSVCGPDTCFDGTFPPPDECGNGVCDLGENSLNCPIDCGTLPPLPETGACCNPDNSCQNNVTENVCNLRGTYQGDGSSCSTTTCSSNNAPSLAPSQGAATGNLYVTSTGEQNDFKKVPLSENPATGSASATVNLPQGNYAVGVSLPKGISTNSITCSDSNGDITDNLSNVKIGQETTTCAVFTTFTQSQKPPKPPKKPCGAPNECKTGPACQASGGVPISNTICEDKKPPEICCAPKPVSKCKIPPNDCKTNVECVEGGGHTIPGKCDEEGKICCTPPPPPPSPCKVIYKDKVLQCVKNTAKGSPECPKDETCQFKPNTTSDCQCRPSISSPSLFQSVIDVLASPIKFFLKLFTF